MAKAHTHTHTHTHTDISLYLNSKTTGTLLFFRYDFGDQQVLIQLIFYEMGAKM